MKSNYKKIGDFISQVKIKNTNGNINLLLGVNLDKNFIPSVANIVGTDLTKYKVVKKGQFGCKLMSVGRDKKLPISLLENYDEAIISSAYYVFEIIDNNELLNDYLMMWFSRPESDRYLWFQSGGDIRGRITWEDLCGLPINVPSIEKQQQIVAEYNAVVNRIKLNEQLNQKLEETAQVLYKHWFNGLDDVSENSVTLDNYIVFNPKHTIKKSEIISYVEMSDLQEDLLSIKKTIKREFTSGSKFKNYDTLFARITPCLENGKTAYVDCLVKDEIAFGSTEFIVMRSKEGVSPYWAYCMARDGNFRSHAISSMVGSSGRQRVHSDYLKDYLIPKIDYEKMSIFHKNIDPLFKKIKIKSLENKSLKVMKGLLLSKMATVKK